MQDEKPGASKGGAKPDKQALRKEPGVSKGGAKPDKQALSKKRIEDEYDYDMEEETQDVEDIAENENEKGDHEARLYHLGQGLITLGRHRIDERGPCQLSDGTVVCNQHGLVTCEDCRMDSSFVNGGSDDDEEPSQDDSAEANAELAVNRRGSGRLFPTEVSDAPIRLGTYQHDFRPEGRGQTRLVSQDDNGKVLIMTDGACANNGEADAKAAWAFIPAPAQIVSGRLEKHGPFGDASIQSSSRAKLRAVIAALGFQAWEEERFRTVVIATDSEYVVKGSTTWARTWVRNGWKTDRGVDVKNKDLWEMLLGEVERMSEKGVLVQMWHVPAWWNTVADSAAKAATELDEVPNRWAPPVCL